ncbi:hypothetical protein K502DRAFT_345753 [Neoconidiobolus thromboides FSU 785]|nr:hypothetical protein K502DRAFT_345753 [Neoconidiobolus thromboides FSU 785]
MPPKKNILKRSPKALTPSSKKANIEPKSKLNHELKPAAYKPESSSDESEEEMEETDTLVLQDPKTGKEIQTSDMSSIEYYQFLQTQIKGMSTMKQDDDTVGLNLKKLDEEDKRRVIKLFEIGMEKFDNEKREKLENVVYFILIKLQFGLLLEVKEQVEEIDFNELKKFDKEIELKLLQVAIKFFKVYFEVKEYTKLNFPDYEVEESAIEQGENVKVLNNKSILPKNIKEMKVFDEGLEELKKQMKNQSDYSSNTQIYGILTLIMNSLLSLFQLKVIKKYQTKFILTQLKKLSSIFETLSNSEKLPVNKEVIDLNVLVYKIYEWVGNGKPEVTKPFLEFVIVSFEAQLEAEEINFDLLNLLGQTYITHSKLLSKQTEGNEKDEEELEQIAQSYAQGLNYLTEALELEPDNGELQDYIKLLESGGQQGE